MNKLVWGMENLHYEDRTKQLALMRLDGRRVRSDLLVIEVTVIEYYDTTVEKKTKGDVFFLNTV